MKTRIITLLSLLCLSMSSFAQTSINLQLKSTKAFSSIRKDKEFVVDSVSFNPAYMRTSMTGKPIGTYLISVSQNGKSSQIVAVDMPKNVEFRPVEDNLTNYWFGKNLAS